MRILVVDDDPATLLVMSIALQHAGGFEVEVACGGVDAVACARRETFDAVILDSVMHDLDGTGVLRELRGELKTKTVPVIFHTARSEPSEVRELFSLGAAAVIQKPFDPTKLAAEIHRILQTYHA